MRMKYFIAMTLLLSAFFVGCSGQPGLKGKIVFSDDKTPVTHGMVNFVSDKGIARGTIQENGTYVVGSAKTNDGLPVGTYKIYFTDTEHYEPPAPGSGAGLPKITPLIDKKYSSAETSGLTVEVKRSMTYDIELDRYKGASSK